MKADTSPAGESFLDVFDRFYFPRLGFRKHTFRRVFEVLETGRRGPYTIVETGTSHLPLPRPAGDSDLNSFDLHGHSTMLFDHFVSHHGGRVLSVDFSPWRCDAARRLVSARTEVHCHESVAFLRSLELLGGIDCLYLDSCNLDWQDPHGSALHHLRELEAAWLSLNPGAVIFADDNREDGVGKGGYLHDFLERGGAQRLFDHYQVGWVVPSPRPRAELRAWGNESPPERRLAARVGAARWFRCVVEDRHEQVLELLPGGFVGEGRTSLEELWFIAAARGAPPELVIAGSGRVTCRLAPTADFDAERGGPWTGHWRLYGRPGVELLPHPLPTGDLAGPAEEIARRQFYRYIRDGQDERVLELRSHGVVGHGRARLEGTWRLEEGDDGDAELVIAGRGVDTARLNPNGDGSWHGRWLVYERMAVELRPFLGAAQSTAAMLAAAHPWILGPPGGVSRILDLQPHGAVGRGRGEGFEVWFAELEDGSDDERPALVFTAGGRETLRLRPAGPDLWRGGGDGEEARELRPWASYSPAECGVAERVAALGQFRCCRLGHDERVMKLLDSGWVESGQPDGEEAWRVAEDGAGLELLGQDGALCRLNASDDGVWRGRWQGGEAWTTELHPFFGRTRREDEVALELTTQGRFVYERLGYDRRLLELRSDGTVGRGAASCEQLWRVEENGAGGVELVLSGRGEETCRLHRSAPGRWRGRWLRDECMDVELQEIDPAADAETLRPAARETK